jgi:hypothetical protein
VENKGFAALIAIIVIAGMLVTGIGIAFAEPYHVLSGRDKVGTYGKDGKSARLGYINTNVFEGSTYDTNKTWLSAVDPTGTNVILLQDGSGTLSFTTDAFSGALADGKIYIGNNVGGGVAVAVTPSGFFTITNAGVATGELADGKIWIGNNVGAGDAVAVTMSGDATIINSGALTITANSVGTNQANINTVTLRVPFNATTNSVTVDTSHTLMSYYLTTIGGINGLNLVNDPYYDGFGNWIVSMVNALSADAVWTFNFLAND